MLKKILFYCSFIFFAVFLYFISQGFYFTGDTISYLEASYRGKPLTIFLQHQHEWPPMTSLVFYLFHFLPVSEINQQILFVMSIFVLSSVGLFLLLKEMKLGNNFFVICFVTLFSGVHMFLFQSALAEHLFLLFWIWSLFFLYLFMTHEKERDLFLFLIPASLLPLTRYMGISVLIAYSLILLVYSFSKRSHRKVSVYFITTVLILVWVPISYYLLKNKIVLGSFFGSRDIALQISLTYALLLRLKTVVVDNYISIVVSFLFGFHVVWKREYKNIVYICFLSCFLYVLMLALSDTRYAVYDNFPSRIVSPIYPFLLLGIIFLGSWANGRVKTKPLILHIFTGIVILFTFYRSVFLVNQITNKEDYVLGAEHSGSIIQLCQIPKTGTKYLLIQEFSRNHIGQSLKYYCPDMHSLNFETTYSFSRGDTIYSPYDIVFSSVRKESEYISSDGTKKVFVYRVMKDIQTNFTQIKKTLHMLD